MTSCKPYPSDVSDEEWALVAPYLTLFPLDAGQRKHSLREVFNAVRYVVRCGCPWRMLPNDLPPWRLVYQQMQRWLKAGCFEEMVHDLRVLRRLADGRKAHPSAIIMVSPRPAAQAQATMAPSVKRGPRCIWRSIRLAICLPCM